MNTNTEEHPEVKAARPAPVPEARMFSHFIQMLESGEFNAHLTEQLQEINAEMNNHVLNHGGATKAKLTIEIDFTLKDQIFEIVAASKTKMPKVRRKRTVAWSTPDNNFSPSNPRQMSMFNDVKSIENREIR